MATSYKIVDASGGERAGASWPLKDQYPGFCLRFGLALNSLAGIGSNALKAGVGAGFQKGVHVKKVPKRIMSLLLVPSHINSLPRSSRISFNTILANGVALLLVLTWFTSVLASVALPPDLKIASAFVNNISA